ncbi:MAG: hypothetical protein V7637_2107 [Mycobacteriales bacterium]|jgi:CO/xanthine dehydrogenase FAD-binding subunit
MEVFRPRTWAEALRLRAERPDALPIAGGTGVMVALEIDHLRPPALLDLSRVPGRDGCAGVPGGLRVGGGTTYTALAERWAGQVPQLAPVAASVGTRQVRNRGTVGGSLGTAAPTGDLHPVLLALRADVELDSTRGVRLVPAQAFYRGPETTALAPDELIAAVRLPARVGPLRYRKTLRRRAAVRATCSVAVALDEATGLVAVGIGAYGDGPVRAPAAEEFLASRWDGRTAPEPALCAEFGRRVAATTAPRGDLRAGAAYRRQALAVLAGRCLRELRPEPTGVR